MTVVVGDPGSGAGRTDLQQAYDNNPAGAQILLDSVPNPVSIQAAVTGNIFTILDTVGSPIFTVSDDGGNGLVNTVKNLQTNHIGVGLQAPTAGHLIFGSETFTANGNSVGIGIFPNLVPAAAGTSSLYGVQGNVFFGNNNYGAGSLINALQFFPAPDYLAGSTSWGNANMGLVGVTTGAVINIFTRTITASELIGLSAVTTASIFGGPGNITANAATAVKVPSPQATGGLIGVQTGIQVDPQGAPTATIKQGLWMAGDDNAGATLGCDIVLGAGKDARMYYDGNDLIIDPQVVGTGGVVIQNMKSGATAVAAGAAVGELWFTQGHATLPNRVVMIG